MDVMRLAILCAFLGQVPDPLVEIEFRPRQLADLAYPLPGQEQQLEQRTKRIAERIAAVPELDDLVVESTTISTSRRGWTK